MRIFIQKSMQFAMVGALVLIVSCTKKPAEKPTAESVSATQQTNYSPNDGPIIFGTNTDGSPIAIQPILEGPGVGGNTTLQPSTSSWTSQFANLVPQVRIESTGQTASLSSLQRSRPYLVVGFFDTDCPLCRTKADAFNQQAAQTLLVGSAKCSFVAVIKDNASAYAQKTIFMQNFATTAPNAAMTAFVQAVLPAGYVYPTTAVFDQTGNLVEAKTNDFGPQSVLSYCI